jgi:hypothetical protein
MGRLGEFLELFYGPRQTFQTLHARVRHMEPALDSAAEPCDGPIGKRRTDLPPSPAVEEEFEFWAQLPDRVRFEERRVKDGELKSSLELINGSEMWVRHSDGTVEQGSGRRQARDEGIHLPTDYQHHFDRALQREIFAALVLKETGTSRVVNRECVNIHAMLAPSARLWPHWLSSIANEYELAGDLERAVLLSIVCKLDGQTVETYEVVEIEFDRALDESLFKFEPSQGEPVEAAKPISERVSLLAAARRAPFKVLRPMKLPGEDQLEPHVTYHPSRPNCRDEHLTIFFLGDGPFGRLWINQSSQPNPETVDKLEWTEIERNGRRFQLSDPAVENGLRVLWFEHLGTHVEIMSDLTAEEMIAIALEMEEIATS